MFLLINSFCFLLPPASISSAPFISVLQQPPSTLLSRGVRGLLSNRGGAEAASGAGRGAGTGTEAERGKRARTRRNSLVRSRPGGRRRLSRRALQAASFHTVLRPFIASAWHPHCRAVWLKPPRAFRGCLRTESRFLHLLVSFPNCRSASPPTTQSLKQSTSKTRSVSPCFTRCNIFP